MKYGRQLQSALNRFDQSLARLHTMVKRGENKAAIDYMQEGQLKECYEELLYYTWSCWYPINGKPCNECKVCEDRIIECKE